MSNRGPDYPERVIAALPKRLQVFMAKRVLEGYKFQCAPLRMNAGNRWWNVKRFDGATISGIGGLQLQDVLRRMAKWLKDQEARQAAKEKRDGILAEKAKAEAAQLGHGARPKVGSRRLHRAS